MSESRQSVEVSAQQSGEEEASVMRFSPLIDLGPCGVAGCDRPASALVGHKGYRCEIHVPIEPTKVSCEHVCASTANPHHKPSESCICARCGLRFDGRIRPEAGGPQ